MEETRGSFEKRQFLISVSLSIIASVSSFIYIIKSFNAIHTFAETGAWQ